jgi:hypothetical protein
MVQYQPCVLAGKDSERIWCYRFEVNYSATTALLSHFLPSPRYSAFLIPAAATFGGSRGTAAPTMAMDVAGMAFPVAFRQPPAVVEARLGQTQGDVIIR